MLSTEAESVIYVCGVYDGWQMLRDSGRTRKGEGSGFVSEGRCIVVQRSWDLYNIYITAGA